MLGHFRGMHPIRILRAPREAGVSRVAAIWEEPAGYRDSSMISIAFTHA